MSAAGRKKRKSVPEIRARKGGEPIVSLTAYSAPMASLLDPHTDLFIVGDSVGMVLYGLVCGYCLHVLPCKIWGFKE